VLLGGCLAAACAALALVSPVAHAAFGIAKWEAGTCNGNEVQVTSCTYASPTSAFYSQSAGHPPWGLTAFELAHTGSGAGRLPEGSLRRIRVDIPPGLAANPEAPAKCTRAQFGSKSCPADSQAGLVELEAVAELPVVGNTLLTLKGKVFNLVQEPGFPLLFGIEIKAVEPLVESTDLILEGHVSDAPEAALAARGVASGDFHEFFEIHNIPKEVAVEPLGLPLTKAPLRTLTSKLFFNGHAGTTASGNENFLTMPSNCAAPTTSFLEVESYAGEVQSAPTTPPVGVTGCDKVPFSPTTVVKPETSMSDQPDGGTTEINVPQNATSTNTADIKDVHLTLPEGLTLNPSAAHGLAACSESQFAAGGCPASSKVGSVTIETDLPPGSLSGGVTPGSAGGVFLGSPSGAPITDSPFHVYLDAESVYGVSVRLKGLAEPDATTGRLRVSFLNNPQLPFSSLILKLNGGPRAPLANPLTCGTSRVEALFTPYTGFAPATPFAPFSTDANGHGGACASPLSFTLGQSTQSSSAKAGAYTSYTFNLQRNDGQQYLSALSTTLPAGLLGAIPSVPLCGEAQAQAGTCGAASQIGSASAIVGAGGEPYGFSGPVYLTGPYNGAPYGLSIPIEASAGPFDLGRITTRASIGVDTYTGRVIASATLPRIFKGIPLRLRGLSVAVTRPSFLFNPSSCAPLATNSALTSTFGASLQTSSLFRVSGCSALAFKPSFAAKTTSKTRKVTGASLLVSVKQGNHQANMRSVVVQLPKALPSRLSTLNKACLAATYAANPRSCPSGAMVGTVTVTTPVLPQPLSGPAYLVSHGGAAFPDLNLLLEGDGGVRVILVGNTNITGGITTSTFAAIPDVPVSSFSLSLPTGPHSALSPFGDFCTKPLIMPTTITAQNGAQIKQSTVISVPDCGVRILRHRVSGHRLILTLKTFTAGRVSIAARGLRTVSRRLSRARTFTIAVSLGSRGRATLAAGRRLKVRVRVGFVPRNRREAHSTAFASVTFRH
jgi:hypothetical protein